MPNDLFYGSARDFGFLPPGTMGDVQMFIGNMPSVTANCQRWSKPRGVTMHHFLLISGGGGGGGGFSAASTNARGGGGGGGCSGVSMHLIPTICVPDVLWVAPGSGGLGGSGSGVNGGGSVNSAIFTSQGISSAVIPNLIFVANASSPGGGNAGAAGGGGNGGLVPTITTKGTIGWMGAYALQIFTVGLVGANGGAQTGAVGASVSAGWNTLPLTPGAGGAGVNTVNTGFAGGNVTLQASLDLPDGLSGSGTVASGLAGGAGAAGNGNAGMQFYNPLLGTGGSGGGSSDGSTGGKGGDGAIGCGGGGGGAGVTGGAGGNGGPGIVVITSW